MKCDRCENQAAYTRKYSGEKLETTLKNSKAVIVATAHKEFTELTPLFFKKNGIKIVVDGRNCLDKKQFEDSEILYRGIGR